MIGGSHTSCFRAAIKDLFQQNNYGFLAMRGMDLYKRCIINDGSEISIKDKYSHIEDFSNNLFRQMAAGYTPFISAYNYAILSTSIPLDCPMLVHGDVDIQLIDYHLRLLKSRVLMEGIFKKYLEEIDIPIRKIMEWVKKIESHGIASEKIFVLLQPYSCRGNLDCIERRNSADLSDIVLKTNAYISEIFLEYYRINVILPPPGALVDGFFIPNAFSLSDGSEDSRALSHSIVRNPSKRLDRHHKNRKYAKLLIQSLDNRFK